MDSKTLASINANISDSLYKLGTDIGNTIAEAIEDAAKTMLHQHMHQHMDQHLQLVRHWQKGGKVYVETPSGSSVKITSLTHQGKLISQSGHIYSGSLPVTLAPIEGES